jgi:hypothetical protein
MQGVPAACDARGKLLGGDEAGARDELEGPLRDRAPVREIRRKSFVRKLLSEGFRLRRQQIHSGTSSQLCFFQHFGSYVDP